MVEALTIWRLTTPVAMLDAGDWVWTLFILPP